MSTSIVTNDSISNITNYEVSAEARIGSNGWESGDPEYSVGVSPSDFSTGRKTWDPAPSDKIESDWVNVQLVVNPGGGSQAVGWTVSGGDTVPLYCNNASYGTISTVKVRSAVQVGGAAMWFKELVFRYYSGSTLQETITYGEVAASTLEEGEVQEQILTVTPSSSSNNNKIVVEGQVKLLLNSIDIPDPSAIFGQIFIL